MEEAYSRFAPQPLTSANVLTRDAVVNPPHKTPAVSPSLNLQPAQREAPSGPPFSVSRGITGGPGATSRAGGGSGSLSAASRTALCSERLAVMAH